MIPALAFVLLRESDHRREFWTGSEWSVNFILSTRFSDSTEARNHARAQRIDSVFMVLPVSCGEARRAYP